MVSANSPTARRDAGATPRGGVQSLRPTQQDPGTVGPIPGWRYRFPDALPLLLVGGAALMLALLAHAPSGGGPLAGRVPLWSAFTAMGGVVLGGGVTILVAGGDDRIDPFGMLCDPTARRSLLRRPGGPGLSSFRRAGSEGAPRSGFAPVGEPPRPPNPRVPSADPPRPLAPARPVPSAPARRALPLREPGELEKTLREVETALDEIVSAARQAPPEPAARPEVAPRSPPVRPPTSGPLAASATRAGPIGAATPPPVAGPFAAGPSRPRGSAARCVGCGRETAAASPFESCTLCGEPLCQECDRLARAAGHRGLCPNCEELLFRLGGPR
jgi:hypothetical protein